jgi:hypothetical protein
VSSLTLVDADTSQPISQYNPIVNGATINRATLPTQNITIQANTSPATVGSVAFDLVNSGYLNTANTAPYDLCGTAPCSNLGVGLHSLDATPYMGPNQSGGAGNTASISFSVIDPTPTPAPTPSPTPTPAPKATTLTSTLVLTSANNGHTFNNYRISTTSGPCVHAVGASNITISNSNIGPCGVAGNVDAEGIRFTGGDSNKVFDSYIHVESTTATGGVETHAGIWADGSTNLTAQGNVIAYTGTGIAADGTNGTGTAAGLVATGNYVLNSRGGTGTGGGSYLGTGIAAIGTSGSTIAKNYIYQCVTSGNGVPCVAGPYLWDEKVEDDISLFLTNNALVQQNYIVGGHSCTGDAYTVDLGANSDQALDNIVIGSQGGMQIGSGTNNVMSGNKVIQQQNMCGTDVPFVVMNDYPGTYACGPSTLTNNYGWNTARGSGFWNSGGCGTVTQSGNNFTSSATSALLPIATMLPPPLIPPLPKNCVVKSPYTTQTSLPSCP